MLFCVLFLVGYGPIYLLTYKIKILLFFHVAGPVAAALTGAVGYRLLVAIGGILVFCGILLSAFAKSVNVLYFTLGLLPGNINDGC